MLGDVLKVTVAVMVLIPAAMGGWVVAGGPLAGHASTPATVDTDAAAELGFVEPQVEPVQIQETIAIGGVEKRLNISGYMMLTGTEDGTARVLAMTLPGWSVAGVALNPLAHVPLKQAVNQVLPRLPMDTPEVSHEGQSDLKFGPKDTTAGEYAVEGQDMRLVITRATMNGDLVFAIGMYPAEDEAARDRIEALFGNVTHG